MGGGGGEDHVCHHFLRCKYHNAKLFYSFSVWEKTAFRFQYILKIVSDLLTGQYELQCACTEQFSLEATPPTGTSAKGVALRLVNMRGGDFHTYGSHS